jgi:hypothetical protein
MIKNPNIMSMTLTIISLAGIAIASAASSLLVQSASATNALNEPSLDGWNESGNTMTATTDVSNEPLGRLFMVVEFGETNVNPINATYIQTSTINNVTLILPDNATVTATEIANVTVSILPNGLAIDKGQSHIVIDGNNGAEEIATTTFVDLARLNPDGSGSGTGIVFFSSNSTGQLAFLDGMVGINDSEFSHGTGTVRVWEWKGDTIPFENSNAPQ